jgi:uncharacterized Zn finger protein (UPF0148 family)
MSHGTCHTCGADLWQHFDGDIVCLECERRAEAEAEANADEPNEDWFTEAERGER